MTYEIVYSPQFAKSLRRCQKRGFDMSEFVKVSSILADGGKLPEKYRQHKLTGEYAGCWECHIKPDWLLVWKRNDRELLLLFIMTGSHTDIFDKKRKL